MKQSKNLKVNQSKSNYKNSELGNLINKCNYKSRNYLMISSELLIRTTKEFLWEAMVQDQHLLYFNPFIKNQSLGIVNGLGYRDKAEYHSSIRFEREVIEYVEGEKIKFRLDFENKNHEGFSLFEVIDSKQEGYINFKLTVETNAYEKVPRPIWHFIAYFFLVASISKYANSVVKGMEYYCKTGKKVKQNQFGNHKQFS
jgi:hypothetical protein